MVEPAVVTAFHSFFTSATRTALRPAVPSHSAFRAALVAVTASTVHAVRTRLSPRAQGKQRAGPTLEDECRRWLSEMGVNQQIFALAHSLWYPDRNRLFMWKEVIPRRHSSARRTLNDLLFATDLPPRASPLRAFLRTITSAAYRAVPNRAEDPRLFLDPDYLVSRSFLPERSWDAWLRLRESGQLGDLTQSQLLMFGEILVQRVEQVEAGVETETVRVWGIRVAEFLQDCRTRKSFNVDHHRPHCLAARASALRGDLDGCLKVLAKLRSSLSGPSSSQAKMSTRLLALLPVYESLLIATWRRSGVEAALDVLAEHWDHLEPFLSVTSDVGSERKAKHLRQTLYDLCELVDPPTSFLSSRQGILDEAKRSRIGSFLIRAMCARGLPHDASNVLKEMQRQSIPFSPEEQLPIIRGLAREDAIEAANTLYTQISDKWGSSAHDSQAYLFTGLYLFAHQGNEMFAQDYFDKLSKLGSETPDTKALLMHASAMKGNVERVEELFLMFYPLANGKRCRRPKSWHYSTIIFAYAQRQDFDGMNRWLEIMAREGYPPDEVVYNMILRSFAMRGDVESLAAVLSRMRDVGTPPSAASYTMAITLLANRRDPSAAEAVFRRALREGVQPDRRMVTSVMNAHVEAGSWKGVIRAFDYLASLPERHLRLTVEVYNTLLKAYVLIGTPFRVVSNLFRRLEEAGIRPDARTYALLIQSACDARKMDVAVEIFHEMDQLSRDWLYDLEVNVHVLTIIMGGYLRIGEKEQAQAVYNEMRERNIQPNSTTFATILKSYVDEGTEESINAAEEFLAEIMHPESRKSWAKPTGLPSGPFQVVYSPLLSAYTRDRSKVEQVEQKVQEMLDAGAEPSLHSLVFLLDAYRRSGNIAAVKEIWTQVFTLGQQYTKTDLLVKPFEVDRNFPHGDILCIPLSIYIDALSAAGEHTEIASVWQRFKAAGFRFNSHNWNHLAVALVRAGEPERAFEVVEHVILPYQRQAQRIVVDRDRKPDSPLSSEGISSSTGGEELASEAPLHKAKARSSAMWHAIRHSRSWNNPELDAEYADDFAHPLHILHQVSPSWNTWVPHSATITVLLDAFYKLAAGEPVQPVVRREVAPIVSASTDGDAGMSSAAATLTRIRSNYPQTCAILEEAFRKTRRTSDGFTHRWDGQRERSR